MRRAPVLTLAVVCPLLLVMCGGGSEERQRAAPRVAPPPAADASVTGVVVFRPPNASRIFVPGFPVKLQGGSAQTARTDVTGRYRFSGVGPGKYTVCWEAPGWAAGCTNEVEIKDGQSVYPRPVELQAANPNSVAWGAIALADGSPPTLIDRATGTAAVPTIEVLDASGQPLASGGTNADGMYAIGVAGTVGVVRAAAGAARQERDLRALGAAGGAQRTMTLSNRRPVISDIAVRRNGQPVTSVDPGTTVTLHPAVADPDGDPLSYQWSAGGGTITGAPDGTATWQVPDFPARLTAYVTVTDGSGGAARHTVSLSVGGASARLATGAPGAARCSPMSLTDVPPPSGYPPTPPFLTFLNAATDHSAAYYKAVDPNNRVKTLGDWWARAGFSPTDGSGGVAKAAYLNWNDLGFGRDMYFNQVGKNVYAWVTNYGCPDNDPRNADLAAKPNPADAVATVCMEFSPVDGSTTPIVKFYVYLGGVSAGTRTGQADLDGWGNKFVPNLCQDCHGDSIPYSGGKPDLRSSFLPFDLALLRYPKGATTPPASDLAAYYKMNRIIADSTHPSAAIVSLVNGWYTPLNSPPTQDNNYIPVGWKGGTVPLTAARLYQNVVVPGCRTCHYSMNTSINWDSYVSFQSNQSFVNLYVCDRGPVMPHAAVTYINFWTNAYKFPTSPPQFLGNYSDVNWPALGRCTGR